MKKQQHDLVSLLYIRGEYRGGEFYSMLIFSLGIGRVHLEPVSLPNWHRYRYAIISQAEDVPLNLALASIRAARILYADRLIRNVIRAPFGCFDFDVLRLDDSRRPRMMHRALVQIIARAAVETARLESRIGAWRAPRQSATDR